MFWGDDGNVYRRIVIFHPHHIGDTASFVAAAARLSFGYQLRMIGFLSSNRKKEVLVGPVSWSW